MAGNTYALNPEVLCLCFICVHHFCENRLFPAQTHRVILRKVGQPYTPNPQPSALFTTSRTTDTNPPAQNQALVLVNGVTCFWGPFAGRHHDASLMGEDQEASLLEDLEWASEGAGLNPTLRTLQPEL